MSTEPQLPEEVQQPELVDLVSVPFVLAVGVGTVPIDFNGVSGVLAGLEFQVASAQNPIPQRVVFIMEDSSAVADMAQSLADLVPSLRDPEPTADAADTAEEGQ